MPSVEPFKNNSYERKNENTAELAPKSGHSLVVGHEAGNGINFSGALPVDLALAVLFVLLLRDPHLLERSKRGQNGSTDPGSKSSFL